MRGWVDEFDGFPFAGIVGGGVGYGVGDLCEGVETSISCGRPDRMISVTDPRMHERDGGPRAGTRRLNSESTCCHWFCDPGVLLANSSERRSTCCPRGRCGPLGHRQPVEPGMARTLNLDTRDARPQKTDEEGWK